MHLSLNITRILAQIRLYNLYNPRLIIESKVISLKDESYCNYCGKQDTLFHSIIECKYYSEIRKNFELPFLVNEKLNLFYILEKPNVKVVKQFVKYLVSVLERKNNNL